MSCQMAATSKCCSLVKKKKKKILDAAFPHSRYIPSMSFGGKILSATIHIHMLLSQGKNKRTSVSC